MSVATAFTIFLFLILVGVGASLVVLNQEVIQYYLHNGVS